MRFKNSLLALAMTILIVPMSASARYGSMAGASAARMSSSSATSSRAAANTARMSQASRVAMAQNNNMILMSTGMATVFVILHSSNPKDYCSNKMFMDKTQARIPCLPKVS